MIDLRAIKMSASVVAIAVALSACAATGLGNNADPRLKNDAKVFSKSGVTACLGAGVITGTIVGLTTDSATKGALSAIAACGVAVGVNYYLEKKRLEHADAEQRIDSMTADVRKDNANLKTLVATANQVVEEDKAELKQIDNDLKENRITQADAQKRVAAIDANRNELQNTLSKLKKREQDWKVVAAQEKSGGANTRELDKEIKQLNTQIASLEQELNELNDARQDITVVG